MSVRGQAAWDVYRAGRPLLLVSRALGLAPLRCVRGPHGTGVRVAWGAVAWAALLCCLLVASAALYLTWAAVEKYGAILDTKTVLTDVLRTVLTYGAALGAVGASSVLHGARVGPLLARVAAVDRVLVGDRSALYRGARRSLCLVLGGVGVALAAYALYEAYGVAGDFDEAADWFFHFALPLYPQVFSAVVDLQFVVAAHVLRARFLRVNAYFQELLGECRARNGCCDAFLAAADAEGAPPAATATAARGPAVVQDPLLRSVFARVFHEGAPPCPPPANGAVATHGDQPQQQQQQEEEEEQPWGPPGLNTLFRAHDALCEAVDQLNVCFGFQVLLEITCLFVDTICSVYYSVRVSVRRYVHWLLLDAVKLAALAISGHRCTAAALATAPLVSRLLLEPASPRARRLLLRFSQQLVHARAALSACGLLRLDGALLAKMAGAVATYIVILMQYKGPTLPATSTVPAPATALTPTLVPATAPGDDD